MADRRLVKKEENRCSGVARIFCEGVLFTSKRNVLILYRVPVF